MKLRIAISIAICLALSCFVFAGCGDDKTAQIDKGAATGHEGHDHGPGEHGQVQASGGAESTSETDWCIEHAVPESECTACNSALIENFKATGDWCVGHDLPESHCRLCNPGIVFPQEEVLRTQRMALAENDIEISLFFRDNASVCATNDALIQFASTTTAERAGIGVQTARAGKFEGTVEAPAEISFDEASATVVTTTVPALVSRWMVSPGDAVLKGDVLAILQSPEIASLRSALVSANAAYEVHRRESERHKELQARNLVSAADVDKQLGLTEQARAEVVRARGMLLSAGLDQSDIEDVLKHGSLSNQFALRAQASGTVVDRKAQLGELLEAGSAFAMLADPTAMWIEARLTEDDLRQVRKGQQLTFTTDGRGLHRVGGEVIWVARFLDPHTRTGTVRARVIDPNHELQAGEFGRVKIHQQDSRAITLVPKDAVQWEGCCNVVFVRESVDRYRPRKVELYESNGPFYQVSGGVRAGEDVVVDGAFLLKTELKKSSIGAGCCGLDPVG